MNLIETLIGKLQAHPKRFVFTDGADPRVLQAARQIVTRKMGVPILLGDRSLIKDTAAKLGITAKGMRIIEPARSSDIDFFTQDLKSIPKFQSLSDSELRSKVTESPIFATLMLSRNQAEALISGATTRASSAIASPVSDHWHAARSKNRVFTSPHRHGGQGSGHSRRPIYG